MTAHTSAIQTVLPAAAILTSASTAPTPTLSSPSATLAPPSTATSSAVASSTTGASPGVATAAQVSSSSTQVAPGGPSASSAPQAGGRPGAGKKWSEVCERVQQPDGSVRTSPPFKSGATSAAASPQRLGRRPGSSHSGHPLLRRPSRGGGSRPAGLSGRRSTGRVASSSHGGSSRGASSRSGKSSRSSSRDIARDGDISSRCSSGCWDTSTNSSEASRPRTPPDAVQSPSASKGLLMPDPIRTRLILPPALLDDEPNAESKAELPGTTETPIQECAGGFLVCGPGFLDNSSLAAAPLARHPIAPMAGQDDDASFGASRPGFPLMWDPFGRDCNSRRRLETKHGWSIEPLAKYLKDLALQIDANLRDECLPTTDRLEAYVSRLVANTQRQLKHAPRKDRHTLQVIFAHRFQKFWDYPRNQKVRSTTPEELKWALVSLVENLFAEFARGPDALLLMQPTPVHYHSCAQILRTTADAGTS